MPHTIENIYEVQKIMHTNYEEKTAPLKNKQPLPLGMWRGALLGTRTVGTKQIPNIQTQGRMEKNK